MFDNALDTVLQSGIDIKTNPKLDTYYRSLVERIHKHEALPGDAHEAARALALCIPIVEKDDKMATAKRQAGIQFYGDQAVAMLRDAAAKGYKDVAHMNKDTDLDPLRKRDDFNKLLKEIEQKAKAGAK